MSSRWSRSAGEGAFAWPVGVVVSSGVNWMPGKGFAQPASVTSATVVAAIMVRRGECVIGVCLS